MKLKYLLMTAICSTILGIFCLATTTGALAAEVHFAKLTGDNVRFRSEPNLRCTELGRLTLDTEVLVTDTVGGGEWYEVVHNYRVGYVSAQYISLLSDADKAIGDGITTGNSVNLRSAPSTESQSLGKQPRNKRLQILGVLSGWYKVGIDSQVGYMHADYIDVVRPLDAAATVDTEGDGAGDEDAVEVSAIGTAIDATGSRAEIVALAKSLLGTPYRYGSMNPGKGFDCSGFTTYLYKQFGVSLNRSAAGQVSNGIVIDKAQLQPGDLVLFRDPSINTAAASHVGMYVGNGQFIHASSRGGGVKYNNLTDSYYTKYYIGGRSIF